MQTDNQNQQNVQGKDPELWEIAKNRADFKSHLAVYFVVIPFIWLVWWFSGSSTHGMGFPWAVWPTAGWGVGLFFHYLGAYVFPKQSSVQKEYDKLLNERKG